jgi:hypothetical protein
MKLRVEHFVNGYVSLKEEFLGGRGRIGQGSLMAVVGGL